MICKECKFFNQNEHYQKWEGWCDIELPPWLAQYYRDVDVPNTTVRVDQSCSLGEEQ